MYFVSLGGVSHYAYGRPLRHSCVTNVVQLYYKGQPHKVGT